MENFDTRQSNRCDAAIFRKTPESLGLNKVVIGEFWKTKASPVQGGINQKHGSADAIKRHTITVTQVAEL